MENNTTNKKLIVNYTYILYDLRVIENYQNTKQTYDF